MLGVFGGEVFRGFELNLYRVRSIPMLRRPTKEVGLYVLTQETF